MATEGTITRPRPWRCWPLQASSAAHARHQGTQSQPRTPPPGRLRGPRVGGRRVKIDLCIGRCGGIEAGLQRACTSGNPGGPRRRRCDRQYQRLREHRIWARAAHCQCCDGAPRSPPSEGLGCALRSRSRLRRCLPPEDPKNKAGPKRAPRAHVGCKCAACPARRGPLEERSKCCPHQLIWRVLVLSDIELRLYS